MYLISHLEKTSVLILTALSFAGPSSRALSSSILAKVINSQPLSESEITSITQGRISSTECQEAVLSLLVKYHNIPLEEMQNRQLEIYGRLLFLVCENYYLEGKEEDFQGLLACLGKGGNREIRFLMNYLRLGIAIDKDQQNEVETLLETILAED